MAKEAEDRKYGIIFNIQRFSVHDGPGIRTVVFLKGCPLHCLWCSNPESQETGRQLMYLQQRCVECSRCVEACPKSVILQPGKIDRAICDLCGECVGICPNGALRFVGETRTVGEVLEEVEKDLLFYRRSGGGLTLSGGEPAVQYGFSLELLRQAKRRGINTALETSGLCSFRKLSTLGRYVDFVLYDVKHLDSEKHKQLTGTGNEQILENLERLTGTRSDVIVRIPVIPNFNDDENNLTKIAQFISQLGHRKVRRVELVSFHQYGRNKYQMLGRRYELWNLDPPSDEKLREAKSVFDKYGIPASTLNM